MRPSSVLDVLDECPSSGQNLVESVSIFVGLPVDELCPTDRLDKLTKLPRLTTAFVFYKDVEVPHKY